MLRSTGIVSPKLLGGARGARFALPSGLAPARLTNTLQDGGARAGGSSDDAARDLTNLTTLVEFNAALGLTTQSWLGPVDRSSITFHPDMSTQAHFAPAARLLEKSYSSVCFRAPPVLRFVATSGSREEVSLADLAAATLAGGECQMAAGELIRRHARPSPFGHGATTVVDPAVRDSAELSGDALSLHTEDQAVVDEMAALAANLLGFTRSCGGECDGVVAQLHKVVLYREGGHFAEHRDAVHTPGAIATLTVRVPATLPSGSDGVTQGVTLKGGELQVRLPPEEDVTEPADTGGDNHWRWHSWPAPSAVAFPLEQPHRVLPVEQGAMAAATFDIVSVPRGGAGFAGAASMSPRVAAIAGLCLPEDIASVATAEPGPHEGHCSDSNDVDKSDGLDGSDDESCANTFIDGALREMRLQRVDPAHASRALAALEERPMLRAFGAWAAARVEPQTTYTENDWDSMGMNLLYLQTQLPFRGTMLAKIEATPHVPGAVAPDGAPQGEKSPVLPFALAGVQGTAASAESAMTRDELQAMVSAALGEEGVAVFLLSEPYWTLTEPVATAGGGGNEGRVERKVVGQSVLLRGRAVLRGPDAALARAVAGMAGVESELACASSAKRMECPDYAEEDEDFEFEMGSLCVGLELSDRIARAFSEEQLERAPILCLPGARLDIVDMAEGSPWVGNEAQDPEIWIQGQALVVWRAGREPVLTP